MAAHQGHSHLINMLGKVKHVELNAVDNSGRTALHYAAAKGHMAVVSDLWTLGCNLELTDNVGWTGTPPPPSTPSPPHTHTPPHPPPLAALPACTALASLFGMHLIRDSNMELNGV